MENDRSHTRPAFNDLPSWDEAAAVEATGGDSDLARELVLALVQGLEKELEDLTHCFQSNDWPLLTETAHRMRGATSYCGVPALDSYLKELENASKTGTPDAIQVALSRVQQEAERLSGVINS
ncbi:MAG: Hpt domain-containing protein [Chromatiaceae bacterium]|nr:Hpt domain-containing protein [Chromatiaceae bacterium]